MDIEQLKSMKAPFDVVDKDGNRHTIIGFKQNDPLGVGGGIFPDMPVAYFHGGGWLLVSDVLRHYEIAAAVGGTISDEKDRLHSTGEYAE